MAKSVRTNLTYNIINTVSGLIFPLITCPYTFRVLMADGIGEVNFLNSIISYVTLLTGLGIPLYGIREIARVRDDIKELTKTTLEILSLNLFLNIIGYLAILIIGFTIPEIKENAPLFFLLSMSIILTTLGCNWFYSGTEDFKFITLRGIVVRVLCTIFLFVVVKTKNDLYWYGLYTVLVSTGNNIVNFVCLRKRICIKTIKINEIDVIRHVKPAFSVFVFNLITSIYLNLDKVMLGFIKDSQAVGYYTASTQISHILLAITSALGTVVLPRSSNLIKQGKMDDFYRLASKSYNFIIMIALPLCFGCMIMSPILIHIFCGESYGPSITTLRIICPIIIALGISNLIGLQILYPLGILKIVTISTCVGAIVNLILNAFLIPFLAQDGAAIATVIAETSVTISQIIMARKYIRFELISKDTIRYVLSTIIMVVTCLFIMQIPLSEFALLFIIPIVGIIVYGLQMVLFNDPFAIEGINLLKTKFKI